MSSSTANTSAPQPAPASTPLDASLAEINQRWRQAGIPDLYEGCLDPHGGPVSRERARNVRALLYPKPLLPTGTIEREDIDGLPYGAEGLIPIHIVWPHPDLVAGRPINTLVYFHGGGFVVGDLDSHEAHAIRLANEAACVVVNVGYRLAPEHRFPAAYDDCLAATRWARDHIERLGGKLRRLAVGGDSAGGNLAAAVALACRDLDLRLAAQLLLYPVTDLSRMKGLPEQAYLGPENLDTAGLDPRASPLHAGSHVGLAPAILAVGRHDFLYSDNMAYAAVLQRQNVRLTLREFPDLNHGFFSYTAVSAASLKAAQGLCVDLRAHFDLADPP